MSKLFSQRLLENAKKAQAEKLDSTPIAIIAESQRRPETLNQAIHRILIGSMSDAEWERARGLEFDGEDDFDEDDDETEFESFEAGTSEHDPKGHYANVPRDADEGKSKQKRKKDTVEDGAKTPQSENNDNEEEVIESKTE